MTGLIGTAFAALRYRTRSVLIALSVANAISLFWIGAAASFASAFGSRLLAGAASGPVMPLSQALIARRSSVENRGVRMGAMQAFGGSLIGAILAPVLLVPVATAWGGRTAFVAAGICCLVSALLLAIGVRIFRSPAERGSADQASRSDIGRVRSLRNLLLCCFVSALMVGWLIVTMTFLPKYLLSSLLWSPSRMAVAMSGLGAVSMLSTVIVPALSDRYGRRRAMGFCTAAGAVAAFGVWTAGHGAGSVLIVMAVGLAGGTFPLFMAAIPAESSRPEHTAAWMGGVQGVGEIIGGVIAPMVAGLTADRYGPRSALLLAAAFVVPPLSSLCFFGDQSTKARPVNGAALAASYV